MMGPYGPGTPLLSVFLPIFIMMAVFAIAILAIVNRNRREAQRLDLHARLLERAGSTREFADFLTTEQGRQFLASLTPETSRPQVRIVRAVRGGIVVLFIGVALLATGGSNMRGGVFVLLVGVGMLLSAVVSYYLANKLGLGHDDPRRPASDANPPSLG